MEKDLEPLWQKAAAFHGHVCPGLAIGFKACEAAMKVMGVFFRKRESVIPEYRKISLYIYPARYRKSSALLYEKKKSGNGKGRILSISAGMPGRGSI